MRCAQIRHRAFFKRLRVLRWGLGGQSPPQGHSPNDMVVCVCNLPHGAFSGVFGGPLGVQGGKGGPGRAAGKSKDSFGRVQGRPLENRNFSFLIAYLSIA